MDGVGDAVVLAGLPDDRVAVVLAAVVDGHPDAEGEGGLALGDVAVADAVGAVGGDAEVGVEPVEGLLGVAAASARVGVVAWVRRGGRGGRASRSAWCDLASRRDLPWRLGLQVVQQLVGARVSRSGEGLAAGWAGSRVGWLPMQAPSCGWWVGAGSAWRRHAPTPRTRSAGQVAGGGHGHHLPLLGSLAGRPSGRGRRGVGAFGAGGLAWAAGVGQADLAARGQGAAGLAGLLGQQPAAFGGRQEPLVDLAVVEGAGGDQVVEVAGRLPQLAVALADRGGGDPGQLLGQGRPGVAVTRAVGGGRELDRTGWSLELAGLQPLEQHRGTWPGGVSRSRPASPLVGVAGGVAAGWGDHIAAPAPPVHMLQARRVDVAQAGGGQVVVPATPAGADQRPRALPGHGRRPAPDGLGAGGAVDVQDVEAVAGGQADVGLGVAGPPGQDPGPVGGGVLDPVGDQAAQGVLGGLAAARIPTRAARPHCRARQLVVAGEPAGGRRGGGGGSAGAGPGCRGRHSQGRRRATASWAGSLGALRSWWALALQEAGGAAAATAGGLGQGAGRPGLAVRPRLGIGGLQPRPDRGAVGRFGPGGQRPPPGAECRRRGVRVGGGVAASDGGGLRELAGLGRARPRGPGRRPGRPGG